MPRSRGPRKSRLEVWVAAYGPKALAADRRGRRRLHPAARRPRHRRLDDRGGAATAADAAGRDPDAVKFCVAAPAYVGDDLAAPARSVPLVRRHGRQPRGRHRRALRRATRRCPRPSPTTSRAARATTTTSTAGPATRTRLRARRDRRPLLHPRPGRRTTSSGSQELKELGVDQFAIYLQHDAKDATLQAYGEHVIPAVGEHVAAKS